MKTTRIFPALAALFLLFGTSSCSTIENFFDNLLNKKTTTTTKNNTLPTDRESLITPTNTKKYTSDEITKGIIRGDWAIITVNTKNAVGETSPYLKFVDNKVYGNNGCNVINATYKYNPADTTLSFSNIASTMMLCSMEGITDYEINNALNATCFYGLELKGSEYWLYLYNKDRLCVMTLMHQNFDFLNGTWKVSAINNETVDIDDMFLVFDVEEGKLHGNTGCNILNGNFTTDMDAANSISFSDIILTRMSCPNDKYETDLVVALEDAAYAKPINQNKVLLLDNRNNSVLQLDRIELKK